MDKDVRIVVQRVVKNELTDVYEVEKQCVVTSYNGLESAYDALELYAVGLSIN